MKHRHHNTGGSANMQELLVKDSGPLRWLVLNRTGRMNALNRNLVDALIAALDQAERDLCVKVVAVTGNGKAFCSGADLQEFEQYLDSPGPRPDFLDRTGTLNERLTKLRKPTIAAINGIAAAGGLELVLCCDLALAVEKAQIGDAHANYAAFPGGGGASVLPRRIGLNRAKHLLYTGELRPARQWADWGVLKGLAPNRESLHAEVERLASSIAAKSPLVIRELKRIANLTDEQPRETCIKQEMAALRELCSSTDMREGFAAFREKRTPHFTGK